MTEAEVKLLVAEELKKEREWVMELFVLLSRYRFVEMGFFGLMGLLSIAVVNGMLKSIGL